MEHQSQINYLSSLFKELRFIDAKLMDLIDTKITPTFKVKTVINYGSEILFNVFKPLEDDSVWAHIETNLIKTKIHDTNKIIEKFNLEVEQINSAFSHLEIKLPRTFTEKLKITLSDIMDKE